MEWILAKIEINSLDRFSFDWKCKIELRKLIPLNGNCILDNSRRMKILIEFASVFLLNSSLRLSFSFIGILLLLLLLSICPRPDCCIHSLGGIKLDKVCVVLKYGWRWGWRWWWCWCWCCCFSECFCGNLKCFSF